MTGEEVLYVKVCPTLTPIPIPTGTDICTVINSTHSVCNLNAFYWGLPDSFGGFSNGVIITLVVVGAIAFWYYIRKDAP
jgi:hypothetical protein